MSPAARELIPARGPQIRAPSGPTPFGSIVCAVDASRTGNDAIAQAVAMAAPDAALSFVCVHYETGSGLSHEATISLPRAERALRKAVDLAAEVGIDASAELVSAPVAAGPLLERASYADLLVVPSHGVTRRSGMILGSTESVALHRATVPVLVARRPPKGAAFPHGVLVASDGSSTAEHAVDLAARIARRHHARLTLVSVDSGHLPSRDKVLAQAAEVVTQRELKPFVVWELGDPDQRILEAAEHHGSALIVLGSRGLSGVKALGSVSERVAHQARCSVLVVRTPAGS